MKNRYDRVMGSLIECLCQIKKSDKNHSVTMMLLIACVVIFIFVSHSLDSLETFVGAEVCGGGWRSFLSDVDRSFEHTRLSFLFNKVLYSLIRSKLSEDHIKQ